MEKKRYFTNGELALWLGSMAVIIIVSLISGSGGILNLAASLIGVTSLIFSAKGNPAGPALMIIFSIIYGIISFGFAYYGEMITYVGMTLPMSVFSLIVWLKNPYKGNKAQVEINSPMSAKEKIFMMMLTLAVTVIFYFILRFYDTANLIPSTISVTTSFAAAYLTFRRNPWFAAAYACNDIVLVILWTLASLENSGYISVTVCFAVFFINDIYGFVNWRRMENDQKK